jgi:stage V sporulation protein SpoVS
MDTGTVSDSPDQSKQEEVVLKIRSCKDAKYTRKVAGAMSWQLREKGYCKTRAVKMDAINTATKAVAIVNQWLASAGLTMSMDPIFTPVENANPGSPEGTGENATAIALMIEDASDLTRPGEFLEYRVSGKDDENGVPKLAGAIAVPIRQGKGIRLSCIGPSAVYRAVRACTVAKGYVYPNGLKAIIVPTWGSLSVEGKGPISLIKIDFWTVPIEQ